MSRIKGKQGMVKYSRVSNRGKLLLLLSNKTWVRLPELSQTTAVEESHPVPTWLLLEDCKCDLSVAWSGAIMGKSLCRPRFPVSSSLLQICHVVCKPSWKSEEENCCSGYKDLPPRHQGGRREE